MQDQLNKIWWLWIPLLIAAVQMLLEFFLPAGALANLHSENGPHELIEFFIVSSAFIFVLATIMTMDRRANKWLTGWLALAAISCFYVAGEEISWGQHFLNWSTPEYWAHLNDQSETNLHNTSSWLDQKPRLILLLGVVVGGLVIPALKRFKPALVPARFEIVYPPAILGVISALVIGMHLIDKATEAFIDVPLLHRGSEVEELYLFYFVLLYLIILRRRIMQQ